MFIEGGPLNNISFQSIINLRDQLEGQSLQCVLSVNIGDTDRKYLEDSRRWYAMAEKVVELCPDY